MNYRASKWNNGDGHSPAWSQLLYPDSSDLYIARDGDCSTDMETDSRTMYDATSIYAHDEHELAPWRARPNTKSEHHTLRRKRNTVQPQLRRKITMIVSYYNVFDLTVSPLPLPGKPSFRKTMMENMRLPVDKNPKGYEGSEARQASKV